MQPPQPAVRDVIAYVATSFSDDPDEETALFAREALRLLDTDAKCERVLQLVRAYRSRPEETRECQTLAEIESILGGESESATELVSQKAHEPRLQDLVAAAHRVAALAVETASTVPQRELRWQCMRLAMRCETDASRLQHELFWSSSQ